MNEALARLDALIHCDVAGEATTPPASPAEGECWIVDGPASGAWEGQEGVIASYQSGTWIFLQPRNGMRVWDNSANQTIAYGQAGWVKASPITDPTGGSVIDSEARAAISQIAAALRSANLLP